jgi:hypothetical protein
MGNTGNGGGAFTVLLVKGLVTFTQCITDRQFPQDGNLLVFQNCQASAATTTIAFLALNTLQCLGQPSSFFENFTIEEIIANVICAFGLAVALIETVLYFVKEGLCSDNEEKNEDYEEEMQDTGEEEEDPGYYSHHRRDKA